MHFIGYKSDANEYFECHSSKEFEYKDYLKFQNLIKMIILIISILLLKSTAAENDFCPMDNQMDYLKLSVQWQPGFCHRNGCRGESKFSIHGLWPGQNHNSYSPSLCCTNDNFEAEKLMDLNSRLKVHWPSLKGDDSWFWRHEYDKHGSCTRNLQGFGSVYNYFKRTLDLFEGLKLNYIEGIYPDTSIDKSDFIEKLTVNHGKRRIEMDCDGGFVNEIRFCFSHEDSNPPVDCPNANDDCSSRINL